MTQLDERDAAEEAANAELLHPVDELDWTDTLRELARFASDQELPAPLTITFPGDDPHFASVAVSGSAHADWFGHFGQCHRATSSELATFHRSNGSLGSGAFVELTCFADVLLPSAVSA